MFYARGRLSTWLSVVHRCQLCTGVHILLAVFPVNTAVVDAIDFPLGQLLVKVTQTIQFSVDGCGFSKNIHRV